MDELVNSETGERLVLIQIHLFHCTHTVFYKKIINKKQKQNIVQPQNITQHRKTKKVCNECNKEAAK